MRIVSLVPSVTETLSAWGIEPIACTRFCERSDLPHVGGTKNPDVGAVVSLAPDLVVMDRQENRREDAEELTAAGVRLLVMDVRSVGGLHDELVALADAAGVERPTPLVIAPAAQRTAVFVPIWRRPWMTFGRATYASSLLGAIGARNVFDDARPDYPEVTLEEVAEREPDLVLAPSEPYSFTDEHLAELSRVAPLLRVDGQDLFWWGARTPIAIERLGAQLS